MLRKIRISVSLISFVLITFYFLDFAEILPQSFHFLAEIQFIPALLSLNIIILATLLFITLIFGRVYCSSICPLGIYQDITSWISTKINKKKKYTFSKARTALRWVILGVTFIAFLFGFTFLVGLLDPYGAYGRVITHIFRPAYLAGNNFLASILFKFDNYMFYKVSIYSLSLFSTIIALLTLFFVGFLAWKNGRTYCNTICPIGTILGFVSKYSLFKVQFDSEKCNSCGVCGMKCKASCIDSKSKKVDYSRCINCFNCLEACKNNGMKYKISSAKKSVQKNETIDESKRRFLTATFATGVVATTVLAQNSSILIRKKNHKRIPIAPPGSLNVKHLQEKCISCHLCVSKCPSHVIKPAFLEYGLEGIMQPRLYFEHGFCNYDCTVCGDVCPTGAILPLNKAEKHQTQMGQVHFIKDNCIVYKDETNCGACSEHCPTQAVFMVPYKDDLTIPNTNIHICVGCGGCEYVCPAKPNKAIIVKGLTVQNKITFKKQEKKEEEVKGFGF